MSGKLRGKVALITGAGRGIGRAIAEKFVEEGARVVLNDLDPEPLENLVDALRNRGGEALALPGNVCEEDFPERFINLAVESWGSLDIIVNNAGFVWDGVIQKMSDDQWAAILDVHLTAPFRLLRQVQPVIRDLVAADKARGECPVRKVINTSSIAGLFGSVGQANYASAKAGIIGLTQTLAKEWGRLNTTVNCVAYGLIDTRMVADVADGRSIDVAGRELKVGINSELFDTLQATIPMGRVGTPEEAAGAVFLLAIPESDYVSGQTLLCSGGLTGM